MNFEDGTEARDRGRLGETTLPRCRAFTLIEIMITVGLLAFIVIGLLAMFSQTQRAFKSSLTQTDVLEAGRLTMEMVGRELEQMKPARPPFFNGSGINFFARISPVFTPPWQNLQGLPGTQTAGVRVARTNYVEDFFFISQVNQDWFGTGYAVLPSYPNAGIGTLYRFSTNAPKFGSIGPANLSGLFFGALARDLENATNGQPVINTNGMYVNRIADGVVHFRLRAFAPNGFPIVGYNNDTSPYASPPSVQTNAFFRTNALSVVYSTVHQAATYPDLSYPDSVYGYYFWSNAVPAYLELEMGILEPQIYQRYKAIGDANPIGQRNYLSNHVAQVHVFRQRIPVRGVDATAYQ